MKTIASFGEWVRELWAPFVVMLCAVLWAVITLTGPKTVRLDGKHWECTLPVAVGIETDCREYTYKGKQDGK